MKRYIPCILSAWLIIVSSFLAIEKAFSQTTRSDDKTEITKSSKLFNETGYVRGITTARAIGLAELLLGILSIIFAVRSKKRSSLKGAKTALTLGLFAVVFSIIHFITTAGAVFGSGSGKAGAILAFLLGMIGMIMSRLAYRKEKA